MLISASAKASATRASVPGRLSRKIANCFVICISQLPVCSCASTRSPYSIQSIMASSFTASTQRDDDGIITDNDAVERHAAILIRPSCRLDQAPIQVGQEHL